MRIEGVLLAMILAVTMPPKAASLQPCPETPNCVSTQARDAEHAIQPFHYRGTPAAAMASLKGAIATVPRSRIVHEDATSLRVEFTTLIFRFVDDATFVVDDGSKTVHFRSASRVGRGDLGVNRRRMETIRREFDRSRP